MHLALGKVPAVYRCIFIIHTHYIALCISNIPGFFSVYGFVYAVARCIVAILYGGINAVVYWLDVVYFGRMKIRYLFYFNSYAYAPTTAESPANTHG